MAAGDRRWSVNRRQAFRGRCGRLADRLALPGRAGRDPVATVCAAVAAGRRDALVALLRAFEETAPR